MMMMKMKMELKRLIPFDNEQRKSIIFYHQLMLLIIQLLDHLTKEREKER